MTKAGERENNRRAYDADNYWYEAYNKAAARFNEKIDAINDKHDGGADGKKFGVDRYGNVDYHLKAGQDYLTELDSTWRDIYVDEIKKRFKPNLQTGYDWVIAMPGMDSYSEYILAKNRK